MAQIVAMEQITLDGVYQLPEHPGEGGWAAAGASDPGLQEAMGAHMAGGWSLLLGRNTYQDFYASWTPRPDHPMTKALTAVQKFVASTDPGRALPWENSTLLSGDVAAAVAELKRTHDKTLVVMGSGVLVRSLMERDLVDRFLLMVHPVVLGQGRRLFADGCPPARLTPTDATLTGAGVLIANYRLAPAAEA